MCSQSHGHYFPYISSPLLIMFYDNSVTQYYANSLLLSDLKNANFHLGRGRQVKEKRKIIPLSWYYLCTPLPVSPSPAPLRPQHISIHHLFQFPFFFFKSDNGPYFSCHHWHHWKSKPWEDWEKLVSADLWNLPCYWYMHKIQCKRWPGDICQSHAVNTVCKWFPSEREIGHPVWETRTELQPSV